MTDSDPLVAYQDEPTVANGVHQPYTAFCQGYDAGDQQTPQSLNPYGEDSREHHWWNQGWEAANETVIE